MHSQSRRTQSRLLPLQHEPGGAGVGISIFIDARVRLGGQKWPHRLLRAWLGRHGTETYEDR